MGRRGADAELREGRVGRASPRRHGAFVSVLVALLAVGCAQVLGFDATLPQSEGEVGQPCASNDDCTSQLCVNTLCAAPVCTGDGSCPNGQRCLSGESTLGGAGCVPVEGAPCSKGCPSGSVCGPDGQCRNSCSALSVGTQGTCLGGETCVSCPSCTVAGVCFGSGTHDTGGAEAGSSGSGGSSGSSSGSGGGSGGSGSGGSSGSSSGGGFADSGHVDGGHVDGGAPPPPVDGSTMSCPSDTAFTKATYPTATAHQGACQATDITNFIDQCVATTATTSTCEDWQTVNVNGPDGGNACGHCILNTGNSGAAFIDQTENAFQPNYGACIAITDPTNGPACEQAVDTVTDCGDVECAGCQTEAALEACYTTVEDTGGACAAYTSSFTSSCAADLADGGVGEPCYPSEHGGASTADFQYIATLICGSATAPPEPQ